MKIYICRDNDNTAAVATLSPRRGDAVIDAFACIMTKTRCTVEVDWDLYDNGILFGSSDEQNDHEAVARMVSAVARGERVQARPTELQEAVLTRGPVSGAWVTDSEAQRARERFAPGMGPRDEFRYGELSSFAAAVVVDTIDENGAPCWDLLWLATTADREVPMRERFEGFKPLPYAARDAGARTDSEASQ